METLTIAYATDENYAKLVWCSLKSLLENNANFFTVKAYIISDNLSNSSKDKVTSSQAITEKYALLNLTL